MNIKVLVVTHKSYWMPRDKVYLPILVGNNFIEENYLRDNTGENISKKNKNYCELTALYWAWKNLQSDFIGLCHYRRYFMINIRKAFFRNPNLSFRDWFSSKDSWFNRLKKLLIMRKIDYENILCKYDAIVARKMPLLESLSVKDDYKRHHKGKDLKMLREVIKDIYPDDVKYFDEVLNLKKIHLYNMFVMNNKNFNEYCNWLFNILFELEKRIDISDYDDYQARVYGFLSERLFNVWLLKKNLNLYEANVNFLDNKFKIVGFLKSFMKKL